MASKELKMRDYIIDSMMAAVFQALALWDLLA